MNPFFTWYLTHRAVENILKDDDRNGSGFKLTKPMIAVIALAGAGMLVLTGGAVSAKVLMSKEASLKRNALEAKTEIAYQLSEEELKELSAGYENGEYTLGEFTVKAGEIQSERHINEKAQQLLEEDEEYKAEKSELEKGVKISGGISVAAAGLAFAAPLTYLGVSTVEYKKAKKKYEEALKSGEIDEDEDENE